MVESLEFRAFGVEGLGFRVWGVGFRLQGGLANHR